MKRLILCGIVVLSFLGLMVGTAQAWRGGWGRGGWGRGGWGRGGWVGPAVGGAIAGGILASAGARPYYGPPPVYRYPSCPSRSFCEERWAERLPICLDCYSELYRK